MKTAIVSFFNVYPPRTGAGIVIYDFFCSWPSSKKRLFQMSTENLYKKKIINTKLIKNKPIFKIISLSILLLKLLKYFNNSKKKILILEGASWIFYSYFIIFFLKIFLPDIFIIYRSHNIEYEIRKKKSFFLISLVTKYFEKKVFSISNICTTVSKLDQKKINKYYRIQTKLFPNSIRVKDILRLKEKIIEKLPRKYILFCGSYDYRPNKSAIDYIINKILPIVSKKNIHLILTGSPNINFNNNKVINLGYVKREELKFLYKNAICLLATLFEGYGTRIKIIEAMILQSNIISTIKGIEGIDFFPNKKIIVTNNKKKIVNSIYYFSKLKKKKLSYVNVKLLKNYSMENNSNILYKDVLAHYNCI
jgi:hypothetical protein